MPPAPAPVARGDGDDLLRIEGIEPWIADLLRKCGVGQLTSLAGLSHETLATALRERAFVELTTERIEREDWLGQARRLSGADWSTEPSTAGPGAGPESEGREKVGGQQAGGFSLFFDAARDAKGEDVWQTRVYHEESGQEVVLPGIEPGPWASWILSHALPEMGRGEASSSETAARLPSTHHLVVRIIGARLVRGEGAEGRSEGLSEGLSVEVRLQVSGLPEIEQAIGRAALVAVLGGDR
jgi:hypothetical protein